MPDKGKSKSGSGKNNKNTKTTKNSKNDTKKPINKNQEKKKK
ncbi:hypothetical protein [Clostridium sp. 'White wine YQ']|nr:hypothetical protein [Clostridium sp. 'White wine YQ']MDD7793655.1 hypothetical protein [Clostridium sp. 'White wine YQ']